jgi:adenosine deaminase
LAHLEGFDICGSEAPNNMEPTLDALRRFRDFCDRVGLPLTIAAHAGEDMCRYSIEAHLPAMDRLVEGGINTIGHGTILWIGMQLAGHIDGNCQKLLTGLIDNISRREIVIEICPSSNKLLTPAGMFPEFAPTYLQRAGVRLRFGTDSPTILRTTLNNELRLNRFG